jgi:hypothetical protein
VLWLPSLYQGFVDGLASPPIISFVKMFWVCGKEQAIGILVMTGSLSIPQQTMFVNEFLHCSEK